MLKKFLIRFGLLVAVLLVVAATLFFIYIYPFMTKMKQTTTMQYDPQLTVILGGGGNSGILVGDSAVLVIDTKMDDAAKALADQVKALAGKKPIIVVNTHIHPDHTGGNKYFEGQTIIAGGNYDKEGWEKDNGKVGEPNVWVKDSMTLNFGDETVTIINLPFPAHTASDVFVYLQKRKMLFTGDVVLNHACPAMVDKHADPYGYLKAFDYATSRFDIAKVVPGHGPMGGPEVISDFKDFFTDMKVASLDKDREKELLDKYKDWTQIPFVMSPSATEGKFKK